MKILKTLLSFSLCIPAITMTVAAEDHLVFKQGDDGKYYWYEHGEIQGKYGDEKNIIDETYGIERGREIYDPETDAWYWLDAVYGGAKAVDKEVWIPYIYQDEPKGSTNGKWVRYDIKGKMIKGWYSVKGTDIARYPKQAFNRYYYDPITGEMYKGKHTINGVEYEFDEITGKMLGEHVGWQDAYVKKLLEIDMARGYFSHKLDTGSFAGIAYLDGDATPELLVVGTDKTDLTELFTYDGENVISLGVIDKEYGFGPKGGDLGSCNLAYAIGQNKFTYYRYAQTDDADMQFNYYVSSIQNGRVEVDVMGTEKDYHNGDSYDELELYSIYYIGDKEVAEEEFGTVFYQGYEEYVDEYYIWEDILMPHFVNMEFDKKESSGYGIIYKFSEDGTYTYERYGSMYSTPMQQSGMYYLVKYKEPVYDRETWKWTGEFKEVIRLVTRDGGLTDIYLENQE